MYNFLDTKATLIVLFGSVPIRINLFFLVLEGVSSEVVTLCIKYE